MYVSFMCNLSLLILYIYCIYDLSLICPNVFLFYFITSIVSVIVPYVCPVFSIWFDYTELLLLLIACICSLHLVRYVLPVCLVYFKRQSRYFI
jgi:hypothetical protein